LGKLPIVMGICHSARGHNDEQTDHQHQQALQDEIA
jgi:hypothetical protein